MLGFRKIQQNAFAQFPVNQNWFLELSKEENIYKVHGQVSNLHQLELKCVNKMAQNYSSSNILAWPNSTS
jgi:hypothetical protein